MSKQRKKIKDIKRYDEKTQYKRSSDKAGNKKNIKIIIEYIIISLIVLANVVLIYKITSNPEKIPNIFGRKFFVIVSGSMTPEIDVGDIVITKHDENIESGKIIAYRKDSTIIVHRVVKNLKVNDEVMYQTKGDQNNVEDRELVAKSKIEGVVVGKIPYVGNVLMWLYNHLAWIIVMIITCIALNLVIRR